MRKKNKIALNILCLSLLSNSAVACNRVSPSDNNQKDSSYTAGDVFYGENNLEFKVLSGKQELKLASNENKTIDIKGSIEGKKYLRLDIKTNVNLLGTFYYSTKENGDILSEDFFIEKDDNVQDFRYFLDSERVILSISRSDYIHKDKVKIGQARKAKWFDHIEFKNLDNVEGNITINDVSCAARTLDSSKTVYVENSKYKIGSSLGYGGALTYIEKLKKENESLDLVNFKVTDAETGVENTYEYIGINAAKKEGATLSEEHTNLVDINDTGRLVQQSYYGDSEFSGAKHNGGSGDVDWPYNPVQGGDSSNIPSQIIDYQVYENEIFVKVRPMDWAWEGWTTPSYMINRYKLVGDAIIVENEFIDWSGNNSVKLANQEIPALYIRPCFTNLWTYHGNSPWTNAELTDEAAPRFPYLGVYDGVYDDITENWVAWTNSEQYGIGLYVPNVNKYTNGKLGGNYEYNGMTLSTKKSGNTVYSAALAKWHMQTYKRVSYTYALVIDDLQSIRKAFYDMKDSNLIENNSLYIDSEDGLTHFKED